MAASVVVPNFVGPRPIVFDLDNPGVRVTARSKIALFMGAIGSVFDGGECQFLYSNTE